MMNDDYDREICLDVLNKILKQTMLDSLATHTLGHYAIADCIQRSD